METNGSGRGHNGHHVAGAGTDVRVSRFAAWQHDTLVRYAEEATVRILELEADLKAAMAAYRELLRRQ